MDPKRPRTKPPPAGAFTGLREEDVDDLSRVGRDTGLMLGGSGAGRGLGLVFNFVAARVCGGAVFGLFTLAGTVVNYLVTLATFGLDQALVRFVSIYRGTGERGRLKGALLQSLAVSIPVSLAAAAGLHLAAGRLADGVFHKPELAEALRWMAWSIPFLVLINVAVGATQGYRRMRWTPILRDLGYPVVKLLLALVLFAIGLRLHALLATHVAVSVLWGTAGLLVLARVFAPAVAGERARADGAMVRFAFPLFLNDLVMKTMRWSDVIFLGVFRGAADVGVYRIAQITSEIARIIFQAFKTPFAPVISLLHHRGERDALRHQYVIISKWAFAVSFPPLVFFTFLARESLGVFGSGFAAGAAALVVLNLGRMVTVSTGLSANLIVMSGHARWTLFNTFMGNGLTFALNALLISRHGMLGAAWAYALSAGLLNLVQMAEVRYLFGFWPYHPGWFKPLGAALGAGALAKVAWGLLPLPALARLTLCAPLYLMIYIAALAAFGLPPEDRLLLRQLREKVPWLKTR